MEFLYLLTLGILFFCGSYMMLQGSLVRTILGIIIIGNGINLLIFSFSGLKKNALPIVKTGETALSTSSSDPLTQALILTAIVISFGFTAFILAVSLRVHQSKGTDRIDSNGHLESEHHS